MSEPVSHLEMDLAVAQSAIRAARHLIEDNADKDDPTQDAVTLRAVYAHLLDAAVGVAGAVAVVRLREDMTRALERADTLPAPPVLRLVK